MRNGWIKVHRKLTDWGWYSDSVVKDVFLHILMTANFDDGQYKGHEIKAGQAIIGRKAMARELGFSEQQVRTALKKLESTGEISVFSTNRFSVVTIENWASYQGEDADSNQQITNNQPTDNQQITNNQPHQKKDKKDKKEKNIFIPPSVEEVSAYCKERKNTVDAELFVDFYSSKKWMVGKNKMVDWKASVRTWEKKRSDNKPEEPKPKRYREFEQEDYERADFQRTEMPEELKQKLGGMFKT